MQLIKTGVHDLTTLIPANHSMDIEDCEDGTYHVHVALIKIASTVKVIVNMDKNIPAAGGELAPVQLTFVMPDGNEGSSAAAVVDEATGAEEAAPAAAYGEGAERLRKAGEEVVEMLGAGKEGMKPKAAIAVAVDAFEAAGVQAKKKKGSS